ncbi:MAG: hypothetical protein LBB26_03515 [Puniceicoccales bacterium]|nr:hypothetical protein [Puniceicoccales bacterium]
MAKDEHSGEAYVSDDAVLESYAPADGYVIFHVESETIGKDRRPIHVAFLETDKAARRKFFESMAQTCAMIALITGGVYVIQQHYDENATLYAPIDGGRTTSPQPSADGTEAPIPSRIRMHSRGNGAMRNLMAGSLDDAIHALDVRGVRVSASGSRALIGDQVIKSGDPIWAGWQRVIFKGVDGEKMVFEDASGRSHLRNLKVANKTAMEF